MNICILTGNDAFLAPMAQLTSSNKAAYAAKHNYTFICETNTFTGVHPSWSKVYWLIKYLDNFDWVFWMDTDTIILEFKRKLEEYIDESKDIIFCRDHGNQTFCAGLFLIRRSSFSYRFLYNAWALRFKYSEHTWEQNAFHELYARPEVAERVLLLPAIAFNMYPEEWTTDGGGFIIHFASDARKQYMEKFYKRVQNV